MWQPPSIINRQLKTLINMDERQQIQHFQDDINKVIQRYRIEYELSYASVVGTLNIVMFDLMLEIGKRSQQDD